MKIIHTADWHLGSNWRGHDRTDELFGQVEQICEIVRREKADVLLVAGDIFERVGRDKLHEVSVRLAGKIKSLVEIGVHVVLVPGNHDLRGHFAELKSYLQLNGGESERVHIAEKIVEIFDIAGVQFVCLPYPERELLEKWNAERAEQNLGKEERNRFLSNNLVEIVREINQEWIDPTQPAVFAAHLQIDGVSIGEKELHYNDDLCLSRQDLPTNVAYIALGHIHQQQKIPHSVPTWYCGSFDCLNVGEIADEKGVLLVEINGTTDAKVREIPLAVTPFVDLKICASELEEKAQELADGKRIYGRVEIDCAADADTIVVRREARKIFPCCKITLVGEAFQTASVGTLSDPHDRHRTIVEYIDEKYKDDADLFELRRLAEELIEEVSDAFTKN